MRTYSVGISIILASLLASGLLFGQSDQTVVTTEKSRHSFGVSLGINDFHIKDEYLSPFVFSGLTFASRASYQLQLVKNRHALDILLSTGKIDSDLQPRNVTQYIGYLSYSFTREVDQWQFAAHPLLLSLGGGLSAFASNTDFIAEDKIWNYKFTDESWYWYHAVNIHARFGFQFSEHRNLSIQLTSPFARLVTRPKNGHYFNSENAEVTYSFWNAATNGNLEFLWDDLVLINEIEYRQGLGNRLDVRVTYWFGYASSDTPLSLGMYMNHFLAGVLWHF